MDAARVTSEVMSTMQEATGHQMNKLASERTPDRLPPLVRLAAFFSFAAALFYYAATAWAGDPYWSSVKIHNDNAWFSGTIVTPVEDGCGRHWYVMTCAHGFPDGMSGKNDCKVTFASGPVAATLKYCDKKNDIAVIELPLGEYLFTDIATNKVLVGDKATTYGYPHAGVLHVMETRIVSPTEKRNWTAGMVDHGHSGGGLFVNGKLIGVTNGISPTWKQTVYSSLDSVHRAYSAVGGAD